MAEVQISYERYKRHKFKRFHRVRQYSEEFSWLLRKSLVAGYRNTSFA